MLAVISRCVKGNNKVINCMLHAGISALVWCEMYIPVHTWTEVVSLTLWKWYSEEFCINIDRIMFITKVLRFSQHFGFFFFSAIHATAGRWPLQHVSCTSMYSHSHPLTSTNFLRCCLSISFWVFLLLIFLLWVSTLILSWPTWCCSFWLYVLRTVLSCTALALLYLSPSS